MMRVLAGLVVAAVVVYGVVSKFWPSHGTITYDDGGHYEGALIGGAPNGQGVLKWSHGRRYEGGFRDYKWHGQGVMTYPDGRRYEGGYRDGKRVVRPDEEGIKTSRLAHNVRLRQPGGPRSGSALRHFISGIPFTPAMWPG